MREGEKIRAVCQIYKITNLIKNKIYIGQTWKTLQKRFSLHCSEHSGCIKLFRAINKYGKENFKIELITFCSTQETANYWEPYFIQKFDSIKNGYNIKEGGSNGPLPRKTIERMANARRGTKASEETKRKQSIAHTGLKHTEASKKKMSDAQKGKIFTEEHRRNIGLAGKGQQRSLGRILSEDTKRKISKANKGRPSPIKGKTTANKGKSWKLIDGKRVWVDKKAA